MVFEEEWLCLIFFIFKIVVLSSPKYSCNFLPCSAIYVQPLYFFSEFFIRKCINLVNNEFFIMFDQNYFHYKIINKNMSTWSTTIIQTTRGITQTDFYNKILKLFLDVPMLIKTNRLLVIYELLPQLCRNINYY